MLPKVSDYQLKKQTRRPPFRVHHLHGTLKAKMVDEDVYRILKQYRTRQTQTSKRTGRDVGFPVKYIQDT